MNSAAGPDQPLEVEHGRYLWANAADIRIATLPKTAQAARMDKLQRAGRDFLMRLVMKYGLRGLANEVERLPDGQYADGSIKISQPWLMPTRRPFR